MIEECVQRECHEWMDDDCTGKRTHAHGRSSGRDWRVASHDHLSDSDIKRLIVLFVSL
jgi:hypothetical protein